MYSGLYMGMLYLRLYLLYIELYPFPFPRDPMQLLYLLVLDAFPRSVFLAFPWYGIVPPLYRPVLRFNALPFTILPRDCLGVFLPVLER